MTSPHSTGTHKEKERDAGPPVDYSFQELKKVTDVVYEEPVSGQAHRPPITGETNVNEYLDGMVAQGPNPPPHGMRLNSNSVRICNNQLVSLQGLDKALHHVLDDPSELVWLDASCNQLASIDDIITQFPKLKVLYLHGNQISHLSEVLKLTKLTQLAKLTLHGNPIAEQRNYKLWVSAHLPALRSLDFSTITKVDRDKVATWFRGYQKQQEAK